MDGLAEGTLATAYVLTVFSFLLIITRLILRLLKHQKFTADDYLMIVALIFHSVFTATYPNPVKNGTNVSPPGFSQLSLTSRTNNGTAVSGGGDSSNLTPEYIASVELGSKWILYGRPFYLVYLWLMKYCLLIYYHRITSESKEKVAIIVTSVFLAVTFLVSLLACVLDCIPIRLAWQIVPEVPECAKAFASTLVVGSSDILTDLILMTIPIPVIIRRRLPPIKLYDLSVLYVVAVLILVCVIVRMVIVLGTMENFQERQLILAQIECFLATLAVNAPVIRKLSKHGYRHLRRRHFGTGDCSFVEPGFNLSNFPTQGPDNVPCGPEHQLAPPQRTTLRSSFDYVRDKLRLNRNPVVIERQIQLLQERKTGVMPPVTPAARAAVEYFAAIPTHQHLAHISTEISSAGSGHTERSHRRKIREKLRAASRKVRVRGASEHAELAD